MFAIFHNILGVAHYEHKMLWRTTKFRILGGLSVIFLIYRIITLITNETELSAGIVFYSPFLLYTLFQSLCIPFLVGSFRAADEQAHMYEVVASRPISTSELVVGKYLGAVGAFSFLSLGILLFSLSIQAARISLTGSPFVVEPHIFYLVFLNLPALIFLSSLTFFLGVLLRQQLAAALVVTAYSLATILFLGKQYPEIFDFGGFSTPLYYSDLIGFEDIPQAGLQRLFFVFLGIGFLGFAIDRYPRLAHSEGARWCGWGCALASFGLATGALLFYGFRCTR